MNTFVFPPHTIRGRLTVPGDKSISHRALMLGAIAEGETRIRGLAPGEDVRSTLSCLRQLGVSIQEQKGETVVQGCGVAGLQKPAGLLDAGNSGSTMRLLSGILATQPFTTTISGDASLCRRPMRRIIEPLTQMGATITAQANGCAPLTICGGKLRGIHYTLPVASAQVKSCLLFAGLGAEGETVVEEPLPTRDHTERLLRKMGYDLQMANGKIRLMPDSSTSSALVHSIRGRLRPSIASVFVPGDFSSAAFFLAAALLLPESELIIESVGLNPTRTAFLDFAKEMGAAIEIANIKNESYEPVADLVVRHQPLHGVNISGKRIPQLIDEIPILAILATQAEGETRIRDAKELRVKESDRIAALAYNLRAMGATVEELPDGLVITGPTRLHGAEIDSYGDHRIAMAFAIAGLLADSPTTIRGAECADISFPGFFEILRDVSRLAR
ncbi:3-phosphoshikimate 1-carboxyvinyltransferase [candidate division KSB1 bacterium]|nr:3-phosphoshikimate 1-carboxyvinyltransferase [candidate division KSB1 bacterium]